MWTRVVVEGAVAGAVGMVAMTVMEKVEQQITGRPDSHVPARVLERVTGARDHDGAALRRWNLTMHYGQGIALGPLRSLMSYAGLRGLVPSSQFAVVRLTNDQLLENLTGVGAPPQTWPLPELAIDLLHKATYAFAAGLVADALAARSGPGPGQRHGSRPGRRSGIGPVPREHAYARQSRS